MQVLFLYLLEFVLYREPLGFWNNLGNPMSELGGIHYIPESDFTEN